MAALDARLGQGSARQERVAFLEGRVAEHSRLMDGIREAIVSLEQRIDRWFDSVDLRFLGIDQRLDGIDRRIDGLDTRISRQFTWVVGLHVTTLAAVVAALLARQAPVPTVKPLEPAVAEPIQNAGGESSGLRPPAGSRSTTCSTSTPHSPRE